jgi:hypothetical protein
MHEARSRKAKIKREADAFVIWRAGEASRWTLTTLEMAEATGLTPHRVSTICAERGWTLANDDYRDPDTAAVDVLMATQGAGYFRTVTTPRGRRPVPISDAVRRASA